MEINPIVLSIPVYFILIGIELLYDRIKHKKLYRLNDAFTNISCGIFQQITGVFSKVATVAVYHFVFTHFSLFEIPQTWYWAVGLFIGVDFFYYWAHRMDHEVNLLWLGHVVHHQSEDYNFSVALRQGAFQQIFNIVFMLPLAILGFETSWFVYIGAFTTLYQFWIHTETIDQLPKWFEYIFNTPSHHRVHHGRNPKYIDKNHGGTFIIFDRLFGTFQKEEEKPTYGVTSPTATFDPVGAHIKPIRDLWKDWQLVPSYADKFRLLFMPPGWLPDSLGGQRTPPDITPENKVKFEVQVPFAWNVYIITQFIITLVATAYFLFNYNQFNLLATLGIFGMITFSIVSLGKILEQKKQAFWLELIRWVIVLVGSAFILPEPLQNRIFISLAATITAMLIWIAYLFQLKDKTLFPAKHEQIQQPVSDSFSDHYHS